MPIDPVTGSLIVAGANLVGQGGNAWAQGQMNKKTRKWNEKMYWIQRKNSLEDWQMQAAYNSPQGQMERLKKAGLNPHLVYGNGADAQMGAPVRGSQVEGWNPEAPQVDLGSVAASGIGAYTDLMTKNAQASNLEKQGVLLDIEKSVKDQQMQESIARTMKLLTEGELGKFNLEFKRANVDLLLKQMQASLNKTYADTQFTLDENERKALANPVNVQRTIEEIFNFRISRARTVEEIKNLRVARDNMLREGVIKEWEAEMARKGIRPGDPFYVRMLGDLVNGSLLGARPKSGGVVGRLQSSSSGKGVGKLDFRKLRKSN